MQRLVTGGKKPEKQPTDFYIIFVSLDIFNIFHKFVCGHFATTAVSVGFQVKLASGPCPVVFCSYYIYSK
jgi:hypothetical protein